MDNDLQLVKTDFFEDVECNIYSDGNEMFMTAEQLGGCVGYANPRLSINNMIDRNPRLKDKKFSQNIVLVSRDGKPRNTRVFTERRYL